MHREFRKPLIIITPKSLLRYKRCVSNIEDFTKKNSFHRVLPDHAGIKDYNLIEKGHKKIDLRVKGEISTDRIFKSNQ